MWVSSFLSFLPALALFGLNRLPMCLFVRFSFSVFPSVCLIFVVSFCLNIVFLFAVVLFCFAFVFAYGLQLLVQLVFSDVFNEF